MQLQEQFDFPETLLNDVGKGSNICLLELIESR
jgi:hypothetical protein